MYTVWAAGLSGAVGVCDCGATACATVYDDDGPALATAGIKRGNRLVAGYLIGGASYLIGILASVFFDLPTGAVIVWSMAMVALVTGLLISDKRER